MPTFHFLVPCVCSVLLFPRFSEHGTEFSEWSSCELRRLNQFSRPKLIWLWLNSNSIRVIWGMASEPGPNSPVSRKTLTLNKSSKDACLHVYMAKTSPSRRVTLQAESTLANLYTRKKVDSLARTNNARACSDCLTLIELTRLGEPRFLYGEELVRLRGWWP